MLSLKTFCDEQGKSLDENDISNAAANSTYVSNRNEVISTTCLLSGNCHKNIRSITFN